MPGGLPRVPVQVGEPNGDLPGASGRYCPVIPMIAFRSASSGFFTLTVPVRSRRPAPATAAPSLRAARTRVRCKDSARH